jgi:AbrB family looped-hinge helix DNA binding protein
MHTDSEERAMEATVAERGQITLPKAVRDALGLSKGTQLVVELDGSRIILRKNVDDAISKVRGKFKLDGFDSVEQAVRSVRGGDAAEG